MNEYILFKPFEFSDDQPMKDHPIGQWFLSNYTWEDYQNGLNLCDALGAWLDSFPDYSIKTHRVDSDFYDMAKICLDHAIRSLCVGGLKKHTKKSLFEVLPAGNSDKQGALYLYPVGYVMPTAKLKEFLDKTVTLGGYSYYLQIINGNLHYKYNQIIGGRKVCAIR